MRAPPVPASTTTSVRPAISAVHGPERTGSGSGPPAPQSRTCSPSGSAATGSAAMFRASARSITRSAIGPRSAHSAAAASTIPSSTSRPLDIRGPSLRRRYCGIMRARMRRSRGSAVASGPAPYRFAARRENPWQTTALVLEVEKTDWKQTRFVEGPVPELAPGQVLFRVDRFALTANNITYAVAGDMLGYWRFFPCEEGWGRIPVMGFADVIRSTHPEVKRGHALLRLLSDGAPLVIEPGAVSAAQIVDAAAHRAGLAAPYAQYCRRAATRSTPRSARTRSC